jgi:hypothetical protein
VSCIDQSSCDSSWLLEGDIILHFNYVVGHKFGRKFCTDKYGVRRFTITRSND